VVYQKESINYIVLIEKDSPAFFGMLLINLGVRTQYAASVSTDSLVNSVSGKKVCVITAIFFIFTVEASKI
jgi:hypothetical protein